MANSTLHYVDALSKIEPGSVIVFHAEPDRSFRKAPVQYLIMSLQSILSWQNGGHYDSTHVAICTGRTAEGKPIFDEVTERRGIRGYFREPYENKNNRTFMVFTPRSEQMRANIIESCNEVHQSEQEIKSRIWSILAAVWAFIKPSRFLYRSSKRAKDRLDAHLLICSKFGLQRLKTAATKRNLTTEERDAYFPNIRSASSPKALEDELRKKDYSVGVYTATEDRGGPYQVIKNEMQKQINRLYMKESGDESLQEAQRARYRQEHPHIKSTVCFNEFEKLTQAAENSQLNELDKALYLLKHMTPYFKINTGFGIRKATSLDSISHTAREMGIHQEDIDKFDEKIEERAKHSVTMHARKFYGAPASRAEPLKQVEEGSESEGEGEKSRVTFHPRK